MKRDQRLRTSADFRNAREHAKRAWFHPLVVLYVAPNALGRTRVGITVSSRVGRAVVRNRVRRRIGEAMRIRIDRLAPGFDVLLVARPASAQAGWAELQLALDSLLTRAGATGAAPSDVQVRTSSAS